MKLIDVIRMRLIDRQIDREKWITQNEFDRCDQNEIDRQIDRQK